MSGAPILVILSIIGVLIVLIAVVLNLRTALQHVSSSSDRVQEAQQQFEETRTEEVRPAWDLARLTLEEYLNRNLAQVNLIFALSVVVMLVGFIIVIWGLVQTIGASGNTEVALLATSAGILTQFIGATFLLVYRNSIRQAADYTLMLERMNAVGMAIQILDTLPENASDEDLKCRTKARLAELLLQHLSSPAGSALLQSND